MKIGDIIEHDSFGKKLKYRVTGQGEDGYFVTELVVGVVENNTVDDLLETIETVKEAPKAKEAVKKTTTTTTKATTKKKQK